MSNPNIQPSVITDRNGKVTTVHRKVVDTYSKVPAIPSVVLPDSGKTLKQECAALGVKLFDRADSWGFSRESHELSTHASRARESSSLDTLRLLDEHVVDRREAGKLIEAIQLTKDIGEAPESYLSKDRVDAVFGIQDALETWEARHDPFPTSDINHESNGRESFILYVMEEPSRAPIVEKALQRGAADLDSVKAFVEEAMIVHRSVADGVL